MSSVKKVVPVMSSAEAMQLSGNASNSAEMVRWIQDHGYRVKFVEEKREFQPHLFGDGADSYIVPRHVEYLDGSWFEVYPLGWVVIDSFSIKGYTNMTFELHWRIQ